MKRSLQSSAFSLVEVVLALGIAAFVLSGIVGLFSVSFHSIRSTAEDTLLAEMSQTTLTSLRRQPFSKLEEYIGSSGSLSGQATAVVTRFFDLNGKELAQGAAVPAGAVYRCDAQFTPDPETMSPSASSPGTQVNLLTVKLAFTWPVHSATTQNNREIHAQIARY